MSRAFVPHVITDDSALGGKVIERSLRFRSGSSSNLEKINSSAGNRRTMTYSFWFKRVKINFQTILRGKQGASDRHGIDLLSDGGFRFWGNAYNASPLFHVQPSRLLRDLNAWYHLVLSIDTTQSTASDRVKFYINGDLLTDFGTTSYPAQNDSLYLNDACRQTWGVEDGGIDIYFADIHFIDGYQYDASYFGYTESQTGIWRPKKYEGTYQDNAYHLDFSDPTSLDTLGIDKSPLGNDYAAEGFQISAGYNQDSLLDTPTKEYATLNPIHHNARNTTFSNGNLYASIPAATSAGQAHGNVSLTSGKWYYEVLYNQAGGNGDYLYVGLSSPDADSGIRFYRAVRGSDGEQYPNTGSTEVRFTTNDIINVAVDLDAGKWYIGRNGTYWYSGDPVAGTGFVHSDLISNNSATTTDGLIPFFYNATSGAGQQFSVNFGQRPFSYTPPSGFKEINLSNLPLNVPSIIRPQKHFDPLLYTGTGSSNIVEGLEFSPDMIWVKGRDTNGTEHAIIDSVRGGNNSLVPNSDDVESTHGGRSMTFYPGGVRWNSDSNICNANGENYVMWCWKAGGSSSTYNIDGTGYGTASAAGLDGGSINPTGASVNTESGFGIYTYTGTGSNATIAHGLGRKPAWIIIKNRNATSGSTENWTLYHQGNTDNPETEYLTLNGTSATADLDTIWNDTEPTSTLISIGSHARVNESASVNYIMYVWSEIPGFSKFGNYAGNGNSDGSFVYIGFRPAFLILKRTDDSKSWILFDNKRSPSNLVDKSLYPNRTDGDNGLSNLEVDFLSNGFKLRNSVSTINASGGTFVYFAFAEQPGTTPFDTFPNAR
tara:strand:+ start:39 stop:2516 length:2478 start_codon:yes stop_codon:yes gene_type:complete